MPNHVINELNFIGKQKDIDKILSLIHGEEENQYIDFNKIIPMPDYIYRGGLGRKEQELYGKNNWYDWSNDHIDVSDEMFIGREIYYPSMYKWIYVAMISPVSDGGDDGLIEIRENGTDSKSRKVAGKLTAQEAFKIMEAHWNKKTNNFWETE